MQVKGEHLVCPHCGYDNAKDNEGHQLSCGTVLKEQYYIGKVLGQGGFGITYLGWDLYLDIPVAIKEYFPNGMVMRENTISMDVVSCSGDEGVRFRNNKERFMREAKMLARFSSVPEIVQIKNFFLANNTAYIVMEYVEGITLKQYVKERGGKLSLEDTLAITGPMMQALCKVHKAGLVHRDISPDNIMMLSNGKAKLLDFGAVRDVGNADVEKPLTKSTEAILKQGYAPIEQYQNRGSLGPWTDVYAFCATMYYCLTGEVPPDAPERLLGEEEIDFAKKIEGLTEQQLEGFQQGMALRATERISSMNDLYEKFCSKKMEQINVEIGTNTISTASVEAVPLEESKTEKTNPYTNRNKIIIGVLAALAVILVIAIAIPKDQQQANGTENNQKNEISGTCGENLQWTYDAETATLSITGEGKMHNYTWKGLTNSLLDPDEQQETPPWADYMDEIRIVKFEEGITLIGENAFYGCSALEKVIFPKSLELLEKNAFRDCISLKKVQFLGTSTNIVRGPENATPFTLGDEIIDVEYPDGLVIYGYGGSTAEQYANESGIPFQNIGIPQDAPLVGQCGDNIVWRFDAVNGVLYLEGTGHTWFYRVNQNDWINYNNEGRWLEKWFRMDAPEWYLYREQIQEVRISEGITHLHDYIFEGCVNLKKVEWGTLEYIDGFVFADCGFEELTIPETVTNIDDFAFCGCEKLKTVTIENASECVYDGSFYGCIRLESIYFSEQAVVCGWGIWNPSNENTYLSKNVVFYGYEGSDAERYATEHQVPFVTREE